MATPFIGEIRIFGGNFAPAGWALCDGRLLQISQNQALYSLIGTTYGGDGNSTFGLPDLRGRLPMDADPQHPLGLIGGFETVTLTAAQLPIHQHPVTADSASGTTGSPETALWAAASSDYYATGSANAPMSAAAVQSTGSGQAHDNLPPFLVMSFIIALEGVYPSQS